MKTNFSSDCTIAMDKTAVWSDMVVNKMVDTTGTKDVTKVKVSICLTTKADDTKLKPFNVFQSAKHKATAPNDEFKNGYVVVSSSKDWINEEFVLKFLRQVVGMFPLKNVHSLQTPWRPT